MQTAQFPGEIRLIVFTHLSIFFEINYLDFYLTQKMRLKKKLWRCVKKDLYLRHLSKTDVIQIGG